MKTAHPKPSTLRQSASSSSTALDDARRMASQKFSLPNIRRQLAQKHNLQPAAIDAILSQLTTPLSSPSPDHAKLRN